MRTFAGTAQARWRVWIDTQGQLCLSFSPEALIPQDCYCIGPLLASFPVSGNSNRPKGTKSTQRYIKPGSKGSSRPKAARKRATEREMRLTISPCGNRLNGLQSGSVDFRIQSYFDP